MNYVTLSDTLVNKLRELYKRLLALQFDGYMVDTEVKSTHHTWPKSISYIANDLDFAECICFESLERYSERRKPLLERKAELERFLEYVNNSV